MWYEAFMAILSKRKLGGGLLFAAGIWFGKETFSWLLGKALDFASQGFEGMTWASFPWQNALASVMALVGGYLAFWPTGKLVKPSRASELYRLSQRADNWVFRVRQDRALKWFERNNGAIAENRVDLAHDGTSLAMTFRNFGIQAPAFDTTSAEKVCIGLEHYFSDIIPYMRDGHVEQVEKMASSTAERSIIVATNFNPREWHNDKP